MKPQAVRRRFASKFPVPAVALQRAALREGIAIEIPQDKKNDRELVLAPDPSEPSLDYYPFPGTELVLKTAGLPWPAFFLGKHAASEGRP